MHSVQLIHFHIKQIFIVPRIINESMCVAMVGVAGFPFTLLSSSCNSPLMFPRDTKPTKCPECLLYTSPSFILISSKASTTNFSISFAVATPDVVTKC